MLNVQDYAKVVLEAAISSSMSGVKSTVTIERSTDKAIEKTDNLVFGQNNSAIVLGTLKEVESELFSVQRDLITYNQDILFYIKNKSGFNVMDDNISIIKSTLRNYNFGGLDGVASNNIIDVSDLITYNDKIDYRILTYEVKEYRLKTAVAFAVPSASAQNTYQGDFIFTGFVSASTFYGDGSNLTGIPSSSFAVSASHADYATSASYEVMTEVSSSHADFADSASWAENAYWTASGGYIKRVGDVEISGSLSIGDNDADGNLNIKGDIIGTGSIIFSGIEKEYIFGEGHTTSGNYNSVILGGNTNKISAPYQVNNVILGGLENELTSSTGHLSQQNIILGGRYNKLYGKSSNSGIFSSDSSLILHSWNSVILGGYNTNISSSYSSILSNNIAIGSNIDITGGSYNILIGDKLNVSGKYNIWMGRKSSTNISGIFIDGFNYKIGINNQNPVAEFDVSASANFTEDTTFKKDVTIDGNLYATASYANTASYAENAYWTASNGYIQTSNNVKISGSLVASGSFKVNLGGAGGAFQVSRLTAGYALIGGGAFDLFIGNSQVFGTLKGSGDKTSPLGAPTSRWKSFYSAKLTDNGTNVSINSPFLVSGSAFVSGTVSASAFQGDGSNLTGIVSSSHADFATSASYAENAYWTASGGEITRNSNIQVTGSIDVSGSLKLIDGSVSNPSIQFTSNPNSGLYFKPSGSYGFIGIVVNGIEDFRFGMRANGWQGLLMNGGGNIAYPAFSFIADDNTGMYSPGKDSLGFTTGGNLVLRVNSTNTQITGSLIVTSNVGIGTATPETELQVNGIVSASAVCGELYYGGDTQFSQSIVDTDVWYDLTSVSSSDILSNVSQHSGYKLGIIYPGLYRCDYGVSMEGANNSRYHIGISVDGVEPTNKTHTHIHSDGRMTPMATSCILNLSSGSQLWLQVADESNPAQSVTFEHANLNLYKVN